jgi:hypothetical protein
VAHTCIPTYSGGRDKENHGTKLAKGNRSMRPYLEKPFTKIELMEVEWLKMKTPSPNPSNAKKKKKTTTKYSDQPNLVFPG